MSATRSQKPSITDSVKRQPQLDGRAHARPTLSMSTVPCSASTLRSTTSMPTPPPAHLAHLLGGGEAVLEGQAVERFGRQRVHVRAAERPGPGSASWSGRSRPVVADLDRDWLARWRARRVTCPRPACPRPAPLAGLDAVIDGVAHQMGERVAHVVVMPVSTRTFSPSSTRWARLPSRAASRTVRRWLRKVAPRGDHARVDDPVLQLEQQPLALFVQLGEVAWRLRLQQRARADLALDDGRRR